MTADLGRDELIQLMKRTALTNDNVPLGEAAFYRETRVTKATMHRAGIRRYGDLCELAGYPRRELSRRLTATELFEPLAALASSLGKFPGVSDRDFARRNGVRLPSDDALRTAEKNGPIPLQLLQYVADKPQYEAVHRMLQAGST